jgi:hypothetical protein
MTVRLITGRGVHERSRGPSLEIFWPEDTLSLVSTTEELLDRKGSGSCLENREYGRGYPSR